MEVKMYANLSHDVRVACQEYLEKQIGPIGSFQEWTDMEFYHLMEFATKDDENIPFIIYAYLVGNI